MIWTLIIVWVLASMAFFGSLAFLASRPMPSFSDAATPTGQPETQWHVAEPDLAKPQVAVS